MARPDRQDHYWRKANDEGYRARSAYKLKQIDERFGVLSRGDVVVDLGAAPGSWSQVALEAVGEAGRVVAVDRESIKPIDGVETLELDVTEDEDLDVLARKVGEADVVISDMAPNISGNYSTDVARSVYLAQRALAVAERVLGPGGTFVAKVFQGDMTDDFFDQVEARFGFATRTSPDASRDASSEIYVVAKHYEG